MTGGRGGQRTLFAMDRVQCLIKLKKISLYSINKSEYESSRTPPLEKTTAFDVIDSILCIKVRAIFSNNH